jgi:hypothetical protein
MNPIPSGSGEAGAVKGAEDGWVHEGLPPPGSIARVWLGGDQVREVARCPVYGDLTFRDCAHPLQNLVCQRERVMAWQLVEADAIDVPEPALFDWHYWVAVNLGHFA